MKEKKCEKSFIYPKISLANVEDKQKGWFLAWNWLYCKSNKFSHFFFYSFIFGCAHAAHKLEAVHINLSIGAGVSTRRPQPSALWTVHLFFWYFLNIVFFPYKQKASAFRRCFLLTFSLHRKEDKICSIFVRPKEKCLALRGVLAQE